MLRNARNATWSRRLGLLGWRYELTIGRTTLPRTWSSRAWRELQASQREQPVALVAVGERVWWWFEDAYYWEDEQLEAADVLALVRERQRRKQRKLQRAHATLALDAEPSRRRERIPQEVKVAVYARDGGRCVECESTVDLQYDHIIPVALGGATTVENMQLLCVLCNQAKGDAL